MPRTSRCPTCDANVKVPDTARRGSLVRCPSCEETFQPPFLKPAKVVEEDEEPYDPHTSEAYGLKQPKGKSVAKDIEKERKRKAREEREREGPPPAKARMGLFDNPDSFWLFLGLALAGVALVGWLGMRFRDAPEEAGKRAMFFLGMLFVCIPIGIIIRMIVVAERSPWRRN